VLSDARQRVAERRKEGETWSVTYHVGARDLPETCLPAAGPGAEGPGLGDAPYLNVTDPAIRRQAEALAGEERDRGLIARRIRAWVRGHVTKLTNVGAPRGAAEIMTSRDGVCRDFATLFAAVARAAGVPTRLCSGVLYFREGFFYHAWVECRLTDGEDGWYAFDPTLDDDFVDATHIKFAQGDPAAMFGVVRVVGRIRAEVIEFRE
jgi:transglutaminase-like putative cysteine protease